MSRNKFITEEEKEFIKAHAYDMSLKEIAKKLGRSYWTIQKIVKKELGKDSRHTFTDVEDFIIKKFYGKHSVDWIAKQLGLDKNSVYNRARRIGAAQSHRG